MSHIVTIKTEVRDHAAVSAACRRLELPPPLHGTAQLFSGEATGLIVRLPDWTYPVVVDTTTGQVHYDNYRRKQPARAKRGGKLEPTRRPRRKTRTTWPRLNCLKPNLERMIKGPAATLVRRRRASGAGHSGDVAGKTARCSERGCEPGSRDEWAA